jgi:aminoglycoside phosphotransferase (APT) family kinase protein
MYAITKTPIPFATAQSICETHFGQQAKINHFEELTDGMYNAAYRIKLAGGRQMVLKIAPPDEVRVLRYEKDIMRAEVEVLRLLKAQTEVPVPEVYAYDTSRSLVDNDYYLMAFVPGVSLHKLRREMQPEDQRAIDLRTGDYLRQINAITHERFGYFAQTETQADTWRAAFDGMVADVLQDGLDIGVALPVPYDEIHDRLRPFYPTLDEVRQPALVHWDLWDGNIFIDPETRTITGFLDCERALWGDPLMEVNFGAFGLNPALLEGYGVDLLAAPNAQVRRRLYNVYLWLIMVIECTYRKYETKDQENWARKKLAEELGQLAGGN